MAGAARARTRVVDLAGLGLGLGNQLAHRAKARIAAHHQPLRGRTNRADMAEVTHDVERQVVVDACGNRIDHARHGQRIAVGRGRGTDLGADDIARAGAVLHHHGLLEHLGQLLGQRAHGGVIGTTGRRRYDHADGAAGPAVGLGEAGGGKGHAGQGQARAAAANGVHACLRFVVRGRTFLCMHHRRSRRPRQITFAPLLLGTLMPCP
ncbi:hypothetical protein D3C71_1621100 [compost metagenome]